MLSVTVMSHYLDALLQGFSRKFLCTSNINFIRETSLKSTENLINNNEAIVKIFCLLKQVFTNVPN